MGAARYVSSPSVKFGIANVEAMRQNAVAAARDAWSLSVNLQPEQSEEERKGAMRGRQGVAHRQIACSLPKGTAAALFP